MSEGHTELCDILCCVTSGLQQNKELVVVAVICF